jgi:Na+-transporting methylmalonyl-CoA/oxaloacetate decarboxylase gamma subunit
MALVLFFVFFLCFLVLATGALVGAGVTAITGPDTDTRNKAINADANNFFITDSFVKNMRR